MPRLLLMTTDGTCNEIEAEEVIETSELVISASVGINATNLPEDVSVIQDALNRVPSEQGGPSHLLVVDGACGTKTKNAIQVFQIEQFGWAGADGKINPGGQTITRLNELVGGTNPPLALVRGEMLTSGTVPDEVFQQMLTPGLMLAQRWIKAAQANLTIALKHVDLRDNPKDTSVFSRKERMRLANHYFGIDKFSANERRITLSRVRFVYDTMLQVFQRPGGLWGEKAFAIESSGVWLRKHPNTLGFTDYSGFFKPGQPNQFERTLRGDTIFFVGEHVMELNDETKCARVVVHELAHFCGKEKEGWRIEDLDAYGEPEDPKVSKLLPSFRVRHADTYARFAKAAGS